MIGTQPVGGSRLYGKTHVYGHLEHGGEVFPDPMGNDNAKPRRVPSKRILAELLAYLDGGSDDESVIERARQAAA